MMQLISVEHGVLGAVSVGDAVSFPDLVLHPDPSTRKVSPVTPG